MSLLVLESEGATARIVPTEGARVQSVIDSVSGRELLYQRAAGQSPRVDFLTCSTGGWDVVFPNDPPWRGFPDHGVLWNTSFSVVRECASEADLRATLEYPACEVAHRYSLLAPPRRGLRITTTLRASRATQPFLFAHHPMLAVSEGWIVEHAGAEVVADIELPGRFVAGRLGSASRAAARVVPAAGLSLSEVLYVDGVNSSIVRSLDHKSATRVTWDEASLKHLWLVLVSGGMGIDLALLFEPCTSKPYRLDDAIATGTAIGMRIGETFATWCEVESLDVQPPSYARGHHD